MLFLSVVIPTYNRLGQLKHVIAGLEMQDYPFNQFEVLVVSDGSSDGTNEYLEIVTTSLNLRSILQANAGAASARNHGVEEAGGRIILFLDDDVVPAANLITEHLQTHSTRGDSVVVLGPMLTPPDFSMKPWVLWEQAMLMKQYEAMINGVWSATARQFYTGNSSLLRSHILDAGGFDPSFRRAEDLELAYRLGEKGLRFIFNKEAVGFHYAERSFESWMAIAYAYGGNDVLFSKQQGRGWLLPAVLRDFNRRHRLIKLLTILCLDRPLFRKMVVNLSKPLINNSPHKISLISCSGIYNMLYYQGVADKLGGRQKFFSQTEKAFREMNSIAKSKQQSTHVSAMNKRTDL